MAEPVDRIPRGFLITPLSPESAGGEDQRLYTAVQAAIVQAADSAGVTLTNATDIFAAGVIIDQVRGAIEQSDVVVAVCTGRNANVFYELGLAEVLGHRPVLVAATKADLPFDIQHWRAQMYEGDSLDTLTERVQRAIEETLAERAAIPLSVPEVVVKETKQSSTTGPPQLEAVRSGDLVTFTEGAKDRIRRLAEEHTATATANWTSQPSAETMPDLASLRFPLVDDLLLWLLPAIEYQPDWLVSPLRLLAGWFKKEIVVEGISGFPTWKALHQSWTVLSLRGIVAAATTTECWHALPQPFALPSPDPRYEDSPLLCHREFIYARGYGGDSKAEFNDFLAFSEASTALGTSPMGHEPLDAILGADLLLGLGRCVWESQQAHEPERGTPNTYAGFAAYYPNRYGWVARAVEEEPAIATALGADGPEEMREIARAWFPALARRHTDLILPVRGEAWDDVLRS